MSPWLSFAIGIPLGFLFGMVVMALLVMAGRRCGK
jgi:hypothetical protein